MTFGEKMFEIYQTFFPASAGFYSRHSEQVEGELEKST